ncbi:rRNA maturation RNase YbeY [Flavobacterium piscinae]|uniref:Endoribonuclease YbeY n=1 Tax=Flavobacterium piscinae TaxID=2506424 RepID=A0A4Q1KWM2_9FLAO|nr:rRNA maturation RNase YbeY [Flavobacterium piscinae]MBC8883642.1 rRNA maturation RNase YbeY [Flavobacterium piscinae]RXR33654.1 rRNA maturation RNase YbeY [Flavobacterium piscinae]
MISFNYEIDFELSSESDFTTWIQNIIASENKEEGDINYIFCDDEYLHRINVEYLNHDTLTDIISFDYSEGNFLHGDIFISVERVAENANEFNVSFDNELKRVMAHGVLHYCGYKDKSKSDALLMRQKEEEKIMMFHVEH